MKKMILSGLVAVTFVGGAVSAAPTANKGVRVVASAKALTKVQKASLSGMGADWKLPIGNPVPPGQFPPGNSKIKPGQFPGN